MPTDDQFEAEELDEEDLGEVYPPDHPLGVDQYGTTPAEERVNEPIEESALRELPDHLAPQREVVPVLVESADGSVPDDDVDTEHQTGELLGLSVRGGEGEDDVERLGSAERSAEEEAMHIEPPR